MAHDVRPRRDPAVKETPWLHSLPSRYDLRKSIAALISEQECILVEGTQGFGLSLYHSDFVSKNHFTRHVGGRLYQRMWHQSTSHDKYRDRSAYISDPSGRAAGRTVCIKKSIGRPFRRRAVTPARSRNTRLSTGKLRRVGRFDVKVVLYQWCRWTYSLSIAVNFLDYISYDNRTARSSSGLTEPTPLFLSHVEQSLGVNSLPLVLVRP